jgi:hypothetical protein
MFQQTTGTIALGLDAVYRRVKAGFEKNEMYDCFHAE